MNYINELRKIVGKRPIIMVGASIIILNKDNQLLLLKRTDNGYWSIPGGAMELGEDLAITAKRETKEEIGIEISNIELFGVYSGKDLYYKYPNGDEVYNVSVVYLARNINEVMNINSYEHSEYRYFDITNLPLELCPPIKPIIFDLVFKYSRDGKV